MKRLEKARKAALWLVTQWWTRRILAGLIGGGISMVCVYFPAGRLKSICELIARVTETLGK